MSKPKTPRDIQVRHRLSGAAMLGMREPTPPAMAIDAAPRAGDVPPGAFHGPGYMSTLRRTPSGFVREAVVGHPVTITITGKPSPPAPVIFVYPGGDEEPE